MVMQGQKQIHRSALLHQKRTKRLSANSDLSRQVSTHHIQDEGRQFDVEWSEVWILLTMDLRIPLPGVTEGAANTSGQPWEAPTDVMHPQSFQIREIIVAQKAGQLV